MADLATDIVSYDLSVQEVYKGKERGVSHNILPVLCKLKCEHMYNFFCAYYCLMVALSSYYYRASVANAPNVLQPYWLIVLPLDVPDLTASLLL